MPKRTNDNVRNRVSQDFFSNFYKKVFGVYKPIAMRQALKIACIYSLIGSLWILLSDKLVEFLIKEPSIIFIVSIVKGWVYVFVSFVLLFLLVLTSMKKISDSKDKINDELKDRIMERTNQLYDMNTILMREIHEKERIQNELNRERILMEAIFNSVPGMIYLYDDQNKLVKWNKKHNEITGFSSEELAVMGLLDWYRGDKKSQRSVLEGIKMTMKNGYGEAEADLQRKDGSKIPMYFTASPVKIEDKLYFAGIGIDITERKRLYERLQKYQILAEKANDAILFIDKQGNIIEVNDAATRIYGYTYKEFLSMNIFQLRHCDKSHHIIKQMEIANKEGIIFETVHYLKNGTPINVEVSSQGTFSGDKSILLNIVRDITERKKAEKKIIYLSYHDQLTGLYNRRFFLEELKRLDMQENFPLTIVMGDVNGLKLINDSFGHAMGDEFLKKVSEVMIRGCRTNDIIARFGGDEFVILLPKTDEYETEQIIKRIKDIALKEKIDSIDIDISFGYGTKNNEEEKTEEILKKADDNMYKRKIFEGLSMRERTISTIISTLYEKNEREEQHSHRVSSLCKSMGEVLHLSEGEIRELKTVGLFHDIGKIAIEKNILNKQGKLTEDEWEEIKRHPEIGYRILGTVNDMSQIAQYVLAHHEKWNGSGYPKGLKGEKIPLQSRIIAIADAYDAMVSDRSYRNALSEEAAIEELKANSGIQFAPALIRIFIEKVLNRPFD
ncbi:PAS domain S-box protein [Clostridium sp. WILCCON 0269]|uniref:PAS domain S-box protein n=1 Tax=Candidatus Clostridium eludens TaxID=3381663 RepID=A0ABW8SP55_9CLOT